MRLASCFLHATAVRLDSSGGGPEPFAFFGLDCVQFWSGSLSHWQWAQRPQFDHNPWQTQSPHPRHPMALFCGCPHTLHHSSGLVPLPLPPPRADPDLVSLPCCAFSPRVSVRSRGHVLAPRGTAVRASRSSRRSSGGGLLCLVPQFGWGLMMRVRRLWARVDPRILAVLKFFQDGFFGEV